MQAVLLTGHGGYEYLSVRDDGCLSPVKVRYWCGLPLRR